MNDGWRKTTLSVPGKIGVETDGKDENGPVPPPRKKRLSTISPEQQPCGFKELFGNNVSRRTSCDSVLNDRTIDSDALQQKRMSDANLTLTEVKVPLPLPESETAATAAAVAAAGTLATTTRHRLQRKVSRVGNKKSDKFFGENLSDCLSDEPVTPEPSTENALAKDELDHFIDAMISVQTTAKPQKTDSSAATDDADIHGEESKSSLDRKAEFLMAMLDDKNLYSDTNGEKPEVIAAPRRRHSKSASPQKSDDESVVVAKKEPELDAEVKREETKVTKRLESFDDSVLYMGMTPVEEPIIVPRRRQSKPHICDDDDHLHDHIHKHVHEKSEKIVQPRVDIEREVTMADIVEQIIIPKKPKRDLAVHEKPTTRSESPAVQSQITIATEKPVPRVRHLSHGNLLAPTRPSTTIDLSVTATAVDIVKHAPDSPGQLDKAESVLKKCISQQSFLTPELMSQIVDRVYGFKDPVDDIDSYDDGSSKVSPHSKLTVRKISVARKDPPAVAPIHENPSEEKSAESTHVEVISAGPVAVTPTVETSHTAETAPTVETTLSSPASTTQSTVDFLNLERLHSDVPEKSPEQPSTPANSVESIEANVEATNSIETLLSSPAIVKMVTAASTTPTHHVLDDIYSSNRSILDGFHQYLDTDKRAPSIATAESSALGSSDEDTTDSDVTIKEMGVKSGDLLQKVLKSESGERRDSIVEVDQWFLKHKHSSVSADARRDSSGSIGYDTRKVFPFGKPEPGAGNEFFDSQTNAEKNENVPTSTERKAPDDEPVEHSTLLKYLN